MTTQEAIEIFKERLALAKKYSYEVELDGYDEAMRMAIEALQGGIIMSISNEQATYILRNMAFLSDKEDAEKTEEAIDIAIKALSCSEKPNNSDLISRQDAIDALKKAYWDKGIQSAKNDPCIVDAMTDWAIRQIKDLPSAQPFTETEIQKMQDLEQAQFDKVYQIGFAEGKASAQPERKKGEWIDDGLDAIGAMGIEYRWQKCSNCGNTISKAPMQRFPNFCSNCGADMRGGEEEE